MEADGWTTHYCESQLRGRLQGVLGFGVGTVIFSVYHTLFEGRGEDELQKTLRRKKIKYLGSKSQGDLTLTLQIRESGIGEKTTYRLKFGDQETELEEALWVGFDKRGRCLMTCQGLVFLLSVGGGGLVKQVLADLNNYEFENVAPPGWALKWAKE